MNRVVGTLAVVLALGCSGPEHSMLLDALPRPVGDTPLPALPPSITRDFHLDIVLLVDAEGTVREADIMNPTGHTEWDSVALHAIYRWKFTPARQDGQAVSARLRLPVIVRFVDLQTLMMAEIVCESKAAADSVYEQLASGVDFGLLARRTSIAPSSIRDGFVGRVELRTYDEEIRRILSSLNDGEFSPPLRTGDRYTIFKRLRMAL